MTYSAFVFLVQSLTAQLHRHISGCSVEEIIHDHHKVIVPTCPESIVSHPWQRFCITDWLCRQQTTVRRTSRKHAVYHCLGDIGGCSLALDVDEPAPSTAFRVKDCTEASDDAISVQRCIARICVCRNRVDVHQHDEALAVMAQVADRPVSEVVQVPGDDAMRVSLNLVERSPQVFVQLLLGGPFTVSRDPCRIFDQR